MQAVGDSTAMCSNVIYANERRETSSPAITLDYCTHTAINLRPNTNNTEEFVALPALRGGGGADAGGQRCPCAKRPFRAFTTLPTCALPRPEARAIFSRAGARAPFKLGMVMR